MPEFWNECPISRRTSFSPAGRIYRARVAFSRMYFAMLASSRPTVLTRSSPPPRHFLLPKLPRQVRVPVEYHLRALALQVSPHARHAVFRRSRDQRVHVFGHQVHLHDLDSLVFAELPEDLLDLRPDLVADDFAPIRRREHDVVLAHPVRVGQAVGFLGHGRSPSFLLGFLDDLGNRQYPVEGWFSKAACLRPPRSDGLFGAPTRRRGAKNKKAR